MATLYQQVVFEPGEDLDDVARELIGVKGRATYEVLGIMYDGDLWPTIRFTGTKYQLAAIAAKANGSHIGRPGTR